MPYVYVTTQPNDRTAQVKLVQFGDHYSVPSSWTWIGRCEDDHTVEFILILKKVWSYHDTLSSLDQTTDHGPVIAQIIIPIESWFVGDQGNGHEMQVALHKKPDPNQNFSVPNFYCLWRYDEHAANLGHESIVWLTKRIDQLEFPDLCDICPRRQGCDLFPNTLVMCAYHR